MSTSHSDENPQKLKIKLIDDYQYKKMDDLKNGKEIETSYGTCYRFRTHEKLEIETLKEKIVLNRLLRDLKLIKGIGESKEEKLKKKGFETLEDLTSHPFFCDEATELLEIVDKGDLSLLSSAVSSRYSPSHPLQLFISCIPGTHNLLFIDIETLGLRDVPLILIGIAETSEKGLIINQYLIRNLKEENAALDAFISHLNDDSVFVSFNGRSFDIPFIRSRMRFHGIKNKLRKPHLDLLHFSRRQWKSQLPNCRLQTLEKHLFGLERNDDVPSSLVPDFYLSYLKTGNIGPLVPIIEHNREDVITLARIMSCLHQNLDG
jgi:uncharacterized protein